MTALVRYEAARVALAECHQVDEVKDIRDKAEAMAAYARQAKDQELILWATEIKVRAERRAGEMILHKRSTGEMAAAGGDRKSENKIEQTSLKDYGISADQGVRWTTLAEMPAEHFEATVETAKSTAGEVTTAFMLREAERIKPRKKQTQKGRSQIKELNDAKARGVSMLTTYARLTLTALHSQDEFTEVEKSALEKLALAIQKVGITV